MDEPLLAPPARWADELRTLAVDSLPLSFNPRLAERLPAGRTLAEVEADLARGAWLARRRGRDDEFSIGGGEFELRVKSRLGKNEGRPIAHVLNVDEARSVPRRVGRLAPRKVGFHPLWDEELCDLDALEAELARRLAFTDGGRGRPATQRELELHQELHRVVRREYGDLGTLITLLEQRPVKPERTITGVVSGSGRRGRQQLVVVETGAPGLAEFRGKRVRLALPDGRAFNTRVVRVQGRLLHIAEPQEWPGRRDDEVEVAGIPPFGLRRNGQALTDLLAGRVEGAWHDLARLICRPGELTVPPPAPPRRFYCDDDPDAHPLNDEQRLAVAGAVASPHTFLVQGPPGTGKTEVISESIQQLVGDGKRVLLLAPAHVAVDEVLKRVGGKPGMRPLRITFDDDKVDERVRAYLPQHVGVELVNRVLRPTGPGQADRWAAELTVVDRRLAALTSAVSATRELASARDLVRSSQRQAAEAREHLATYQAGSEEDLRRAADELTDARARHDEARARGDARTEAASELLTEWEPLLVEARSAAHELAGVAREEADWLVHATNALREFQLRHREHEETLAQHDLGIDQLGGRVTGGRRRLADAAGVVASAEEGLRLAQDAEGGLGRLAGRVGVGRIGQARRALADARSAADRLRADLTNSEGWLAEAIKRRNQVDGYNRHFLRERYDTAERNRHRAEAAREGRQLALRRLLDVLDRFGPAGTPVPADLTGDDAPTACGALAAAVPLVLDAGEEAVVPTAFVGLLAGVVEKVEELRAAESARVDAQRALLDAQGRLSVGEQRWRSLDDTVTERLRRLRGTDHDARARLTRHQAEVTRLRTTLDTAAGELRALGMNNAPEALPLLRRRRSALTHLPAMERRWRELVENRTDDQLVDDIQTSALRATNLVCATTKGIVGRGSDVVRDTDYDTLIVDEASRVTDSEFLIGAVRARRWVLVGDEHQLPPHVDQEDEHFLHALFALYRHHRGAAGSVDEAVEQLAEYWQEDNELREFRGEAVRELAAELTENGLWETAFLDRMAETYELFARRPRSEQVDPDRALLRTMNQYLVRSLFERVVVDSAEGLRQRLIWQRRMPEPLARIVDEPVYGGDYRSPPEAELARAGARRLVVPNIFDRPAVFVDTSRYREAAEDSPARHGNGFENKLEQRMVLDACRIYHDELDRTRSAPITVSVLSFYRAQARALDDALDRKSLPLFDIQVVDVIDRIQGQQADLVVISFVRARDRPVGPRFGSWLQDVRRLNVACTRARRAVLMVGHADTLRRLGTKRDGTPRDANAVPAVNFYRNLFGLFDGASPEFLMLHKLGTGSAG